jgi:hypothetical protein
VSAGWAGGRAAGAGDGEIAGRAADRRPRCGWRRRRRPGTRFGPAPSRPCSYPSELECTATRAGFNTNLDCDDPFPNDEPDVEVDPADPKHMVASSNDYGSCCDQFYTTFDGGKTWQTGNMSSRTRAGRAVTR